MVRSLADRTFKLRLADAAEEASARAERRRLWDAVPQLFRRAEDEERARDGAAS